MKRYNAEVIVTLKNGIRDPQGATINTILSRTNIEKDANVKAGKLFTLSISEENESKATEKLNTICKELLSNPILEKYSITRITEE